MPARGHANPDWGVVPTARPFNQHPAHGLELMDK